MAAFERVLSGIPQMDENFDNIRLGDNVVWRVDDLEQFKLFMGPYVDQAIIDKRNLIYFRFATHEPLLEEREGLKIIEVELNHRFENFTVEIHDHITREGRDSRAGYNPELSYGSHFFQDLVEAGILYIAIFENDKTICFNPDLLSGMENKIVDYDPKLEKFADIVHVYDVSDMDLKLCNDMKNERVVCYQ